MIMRIHNCNGMYIDLGGVVFLERTQILSGIQFTTHFIEIFVVINKLFVCSTVTHVIHTYEGRVGLGQTSADSSCNPVYEAFHQIRFCGNESICQSQCKRDLNAANMRPALEQDCGKQTPSVSIWIFRANLPYIPRIKKQRGDRSRSMHNFGTCRSTLPKECHRAVANSGEFWSKHVFLIESCHCAAAFFVQMTKKKCGCARANSDDFCCHMRFINYRSLLQKNPIKETIFCKKDL